MADPKLKELEEQLKRIGCNFQFWGRSELKELAHVLFPGEIVEHCVNGTYEGGFALLAATDQRVLLIDKKPMYLTLEDVRFDMIAEVDYNHRLINATIFIRTPNKSLRFSAYNHARLRKLFQFVQMRVMEIRQHYQHQTEVWKQYAASLQAGIAPQLAAVDVSQQIAAPPHPNDQPTAAIQQPLQGIALPPNLPAAPPPGMQGVPIISAYTRLPLMSRQRRFLGSKAMNMSMPSMYPGTSQN